MRVAHISTEDERAFGAAVRETRKAQGLKQASLATRLREQGWRQASQYLVARVENAGRPTSIAEAYRLADALGVPLEALLPLAHNVSAELAELMHANAAADPSAFRARMQAHEREMQDLDRDIADTAHAVAAVEAAIKPLEDQRVELTGKLGFLRSERNKMGHVLDLMAEIYESAVRTLETERPRSGRRPKKEES